MKRSHIIYLFYFLLFSNSLSYPELSVKGSYGDPFCPYLNVLESTCPSKQFDFSKHQARPYLPWCLLRESIIF